MYIHAHAKLNVASAEIEGDIGDELEPEHQNKDDGGDKIAVVQAGCSEDDVGMEKQNHSPWNAYRPVPVGTYEQTQVHVDLHVAKELCLPLHSDSGACPSPFLPLAQADGSLPVLLCQGQHLDERDGHITTCGYSVNQRVGVGVDADKNVPPLLHYDSSASPDPSNVPQVLYLAPPHQGRLVQSQDGHLVADADADAATGMDVEMDAYTPLHSSYAVSPSPSPSPSLFPYPEAHPASVHSILPFPLLHPLC